MTKQLAVLALIIAALYPPLTRADTEQDKTAIRDLVGTQQSDAWNKHDAKAYAALFTEDGDCVNVVGWWWKGRAEIKKKLSDAYTFVFKESVLTFKDVDVKFLSPDIAIVHTRWTMTGARTPKGIPEPQQGIQTMTVQKQSSQWRHRRLPKHQRHPRNAFPQGPDCAPSFSLAALIQSRPRIFYAFDIGRWGFPSIPKSASLISRDSECLPD
jgi:uncharacterized protein (TIGR02246 family)